MGTDLPLDGRVAVVTGAARGIGFGIAVGFLRAGCRVVALDQSWEPTGLSHDNVQRARRELQSVGSLVERVDVTEPDAVESAYRACMDAFGTVDILVNNAAMRMRDVAPHRHVEVLDGRPEHWQRMFDVNVIGPLRMIHRFVVPMLEKQAGVIVNISSASGVRGRAGSNPYGATKAALTNMSQSLAAELADRNIAVSTVFPGITQTTGFDEQNALHPSDDPMDGLPVLRPESVAPLAVWLAEQGTSVTGQTFRVPEWLVEHGHGPLDGWLIDPAAAARA